MIVNFSNIDQNDRPILILKRADGTPIGVLGYATNVEFEPKYNELSVLSFVLPKEVDGQPTPFYDEITGQKIIELKDIGQFVITSPEDSGDKVTQSIQVTAESLEKEFVRKKITLPESTYKFFDSTNTDGTILGMIMEMMPNWTVGSVSSSLYNKYRTYEVNNENLYNFIKGDVQKAYNCIFDFDTLNRRVNVRDADEEPSQKQVYISRDNLAKDIHVTENTDDLVTRLDVNGADGVDIREVNPTGDNMIVNLDYFMNTSNFQQALVNKYNAWKQLVANNKLPFYNYAIQYALLLSEETAENAKLADLQGEYTSLENIQAVIIQGIAQKLKTQADLDVANANLAAKQTQINAKEAEIASIESERASTMTSMQAIRDACAFDRYFTLAERKLLDAYIIDNAINESSFVASEVQSYTDGAGNSIQNKQVRVTGSTITQTTSAGGATLYSMVGGTANVAGLISATVINAIFERRTNGKVVLSMYLGAGQYNGTSFPSACVSISGTGSMSTSGGTATCNVTDGYLYFSLNASDYEKKSVAWELYEYGEKMLEKMSVPSYTFSVDSANFIALQDFELFKNELELGQRVYIEVRDGHILHPICTGAKIKWFERSYLDLVFSDTFTANDGQSKLVEILDTSISMGKTLSAGKFTYEAWTESGASSELHDFILSALDTAKNAIMSSTEQAVSWDGAGLRLRRYKNNAHTAYEPEQIWMSNNSIMMTDDGWATAKMAIGKFSDDNLGEKWGIIAPMVVGTLLAGEELVIESEKKSGGTTVFRVDADGCRLYNAEFAIQKTNTGGTTTQILLNPDVGIAMGTYPVVKQDGTVDTSKAKFWVDPAGTMHLAGSIYSNDGYIGNWNITTAGLWSGTKNSDGSYVESTYVGLSSSGTYRIWAGNHTPADAPFSVQQDGTMKSTKGTIGGWYIGTDYIGNANTKANSTVGMASGTNTSTIAIWAGGAQASAPFRVSVGGAVNASNLTITGGSITIKDGDTVMFNVTNKGVVTAKDITISGGSITISNNGVERFKVTRNGKVTITDGSITIKSGDTTTFSVSDTGTVYAIDGQIGGWYIGSDYIGNKNTKANSTVGMSASSTTTAIVFWAGNAQASAPFRVTAGGKIYASNIEATGGTVGGWYIGSDYIGNVNTKAGSTVGMASGTGTNIVFWAGNAQASAPFRVNANGKVFSSNLEVTGGSITIKSGDTVMFEVTSSGVLTAKSGTVGGWYIGSDYIGNKNTKATSTVGMVSSSTSTDIVFWAGATIANTPLFSVTAGGKLTSTSADITGKITSTEGQIGGWYLSSTHIGSSNTKAASLVGLSNVTGNTVAFWAGNSGSDPSTASFRVTGNGNVYASALHISGGDITIKDGNTTTFSVTNKGAVSATNLSITGGSIKLGSPVVFEVTNAGYLTASSGKVGGWFISSAHIGNAAAKADSTIGMASGTGTNVVFWAGTNKFQVLANGTLKSSAIEVTGGSIEIKDGNTVNFSVTSAGVMTAKSGQIGGWYFKTDYLGNANTKAGSGVGLSAVASNSDNYAFWAGGTTPTFYVTGKGKLYASSAEFTTSMKIGDKSVGDYILEVSPKKISLMTWDSMGSESKIYMTPDKIKLASTGYLEITTGNFKVDSNGNVTMEGKVTATDGAIGGWSISSKQLNSGSGSGYVALNSNSDWNPNKTNLVTGQPGEWVEPHAIWCGAASAVSAPFRVRRDGTVYIKALYVDGQLIDFTTFENAVSLAAGGSWSGNKFTATVKLWGKISKTISMTATVSLQDATYYGFFLDTKRVLFGVTVKRTVNGKDSADEELRWGSGIDCTPLYNYGYSQAAGKVSGPAEGSGNSCSITIPKANAGEPAADDTITIVLSKDATPSTSGYAYMKSGGTTVGRIDIGSWYSAAKTEYMPDSIDTSVSSTGQLCVTPKNAAGDSITGALGTGKYKHTVNIGGNKVRFARHSKDDTPTGTWYSIVSSGGDLEYFTVTESSKVVYY